jgi:hypothetical protein
VGTRARKRDGRKVRSGLLVRGERGHPEVRAALLRFACWLRERYDFPVRVPVYLLKREYVLTVHGLRVSATFFAPWSRKIDPQIRIATGDYPDLKAARGRDNALAAFICSFAHEVVHYQQWIRTGAVHERAVPALAARMMRAYTRTVKRP